MPTLILISCCLDFDLLLLSTSCLGVRLIKIVYHCERKGGVNGTGGNWGDGERTWWRSEDWENLNYYFFFHASVMAIRRMNHYQDEKGQIKWTGYWIMMVLEKIK